jgi:hypothetical protein
MHSALGFIYLQKGNDLCFPWAQKIYQTKQLNAFLSSAKFHNQSLPWGWTIMAPNQAPAAQITKDVSSKACSTGWGDRKPEQTTSCHMLPRSYKALWAPGIINKEVLSLSLLIAPCFQMRGIPKELELVGHKINHVLALDKHRLLMHYFINHKSS